MSVDILRIGGHMIGHFAKKLFAIYRKYIAVAVVVALILGVFLAKYIPQVLEAANFLVSKLIDGIVFLAPFAIFVILAPSVARMMKARKESSFAGFIIVWFGLTRIFAGIWAALFTVLILKLPFLPTQEAGSISMAVMFQENLVILKDLLLKSVFFRAIWISIIVGIIAYYKKKLYDNLQKAANSIETLGDYIEPVIPVLMLLLGAYIYSLPQELAKSVDAQTMSSIAQANVGKLNLFGWVININTEFGLIWVYIIGSVLIGIGCFMWQGMQLVILKKYLGKFSVKEFFSNYWTKIYPLAWSTSSEVISMPLNMSLIKKQYSHIERIVRRLVIGLGAYMNINGTTMHVILLAGIVAVLVGYRPSFLQLCLGVPIIALVGYGVPGIPGELVLFAVPMVKILNLPEPIIPMFMALYLALQVGLPDSFRTGANVTDNGIYALGLNKLYKNRFLSKKEGEEEK
ncbi:cation:dicarboxylase symporter family transporter [bacterium]|nr:cation:dicarboxylase symporter family transporter [bacterium]